MTQAESTLIQAEDASVFVDAYDEGHLWLSIQTRHGSAHCVIEPDQIDAMIAALQSIRGETA